MNLPFAKKSKHTRRRNQIRNRRLRFEPLEVRHLLATFMVSNLDDAGAGSLRQAVLDANAAVGADEIGFEAGLAGTIALASGQIEITDELTITGPGAENLTIDAQGNSRIFDMTSNAINMSLVGLKLTGGEADSNGGAILFRGGGELAITDSTISGNTAGSNGGGIYAQASSVTITSSTISHNSAGTSGGGVDLNSDGSMFVTNSTIDENTAASSGGGLFSVFGNVSVINSSMTGNSANVSGGGISTIFGSMNVEASTISGNTAGHSGGGADSNYGEVKIATSTISGNSADFGGAIASADGAVTIDRSSIIENLAQGPTAQGGGIRMTFGALTVTNSTVSANSAQNEGGGIFSAGSVSVVNSTISGNRSLEGSGGGIFEGRNISVTNSTITANHAAGDGGGIFARDADQLTIRSSIVADNSASGFCVPVAAMYCFGIETSVDIDRTSEITVTNSLIGDNTGTSLPPAPIGSPDADGNLIGGLPQIAGLNSRPSPPFPISASLLPLADNGGPTMTHMPLPSSPAIGAGANPMDLATDQRGLARSFGQGVDMGAVERLQNIFVVNSTGDAGDANPGDGICDDGAGNCTLRSAIEESNALANGEFPDLIQFDIPGDGVQTIQPLSELPAITDPVTIDGLKQVGQFGYLLGLSIALDGSLAGDGASGLTIRKNGSGSTIKELAIFGFDEHGVFLSRSSDNHIEFVHSGTDKYGSAGLGNGDAGIFVLNGAHNTISRSLVSANRRGIVLAGKAASHNTVSSNQIGVNPSQTGALGNLRAGIEIAGAPNNLILSHNVIAGNRVGVDIRGRGATNNIIEGNDIGIAHPFLVGFTIVAGNQFEPAQAVLPPANRIGVQLRDSAEANFLLNNTIANNIDDGVRIRRSDSNELRENVIGADGGAGGNGGDGIDIRDGANNVVGGNPALPASGTVEANLHVEGNQISGNARYGIYVTGDENLIQQNTIGTAADGQQGNGLGGVQIRNASHNVIRSNEIFKNQGPGVLINGPNATDNVVQANSIGITQLRGGGNTPALGNSVGVEIREGHDNLIGGSGVGEGNFISNNERYGIHILGAAASGNRVEGNDIGVGTEILYFDTPPEPPILLATADQLALQPGPVASELGPVSFRMILAPNGRDGVFVESDGNVIGGATDGAGNIIGGNGRHGVLLTGDGNRVEGNRIGMGISAVFELPNAGDGIRIRGSNNVVGSAADEAGSAANTIAFNSGSGVRVSSGTGNAISQNSIFNNGGLGIDLGRMGPNANDGLLDADAGANNLQNKPEILSTQRTATHLQIIFYVPSQSPHSTYPIRAEFFVADDDGQEGRTFLASTEVTLPTPTVISIPLADLPPGARIVATATDADGNTSEYSTPFAAEPPAATTTDAAITDLVFQDFGE